MLEAGLQQRLTSDLALSALLATRIYPLVWPSDNPAFPLITYQRISTVADNDLLGPTSLVTVRMQLDAWSKSYAEARTIAAAIQESLEGFSGRLPDADQTQVVNVVLDSSYDLYDSPSGGTYRVSSDFLVQFQR